MTSRIGTVVVLAKEPVAGRVKTRLVPPLSFEQAACVAAGALTDTLDTVDGIAGVTRVLAFAGDPAQWVRPGWTVTAQPGGGLDARLAAAFAALGPAPAVLVGMDTPQLTGDQLTAFDAEHFDACLGLAPDGGYWVIGFRDPSWAGAAIRGVPMSTAHTGVAQLERLRGLGLRVQLLDELTDVDTIDSADEVALLAPDSHFAIALASAGVGVG